MGTFRLYTGSDGESHVETIDLKRAAGLDERASPRLRSRSARIPSGGFSTGTRRPRRQFVIILSGQLEIGLGDGSKHIYGPGDARLVEDTTGRGHTTRVHGNQPCVTATIPLA